MLQQKFEVVCKNECYHLSNAKPFSFFLAYMLAENKQSYFLLQV